MNNKNENYHLSVKTRANTTEYNKSKVLLIMHPSDTEKYQDEITEDILQKSDCAVYSLDTETEHRIISNEIPEEIVFADILEMRIVVAVITENFLSENSFARNRLARFALNNNIAVLPIVTESGLVNKFNSDPLFRGMQFLDKTSTDKTEISYEDKLKSYLDKVLVTQTDVKNIKIHHTGQAFLSYRKMDREYAKKLMKAIHNIRQDIAIWYDEFLTPGKHFDKEIRDKIASSDFFTMAMTPNMLEKPNYVEEHEYKAAQHYNKSVLPVNLLDMGAQNPEDTYPGIGQCINFDDPDGIYGFISQHENNFKGYKGDRNTAEHLYYIALGYLNGIDLEVDTVRASAILEKAAELKQGKFSKAAFRTLVFMYSEGSGVEKNSKKAIDLQKELVLLSENEFTKDSTVENLADLINESVILGDFYYDGGSYSLAESQYEKTCNLIEASMKEPDSTLCSLIWENATRGSVRLAIIYTKRGDTAKAKKYSDITREIDGKIEKATRKLVKGRKDRAVLDISYDLINNEQLAFSERNNGRIDKAIEYVLKNVELENRLIKMFEKSSKAKEFRLSSLAGIMGWYSRAANLALDAGDFKNAEKYCANSIAAFEELGGDLDLINSTDIKGELFWTYFHLSRVAEYHDDIYAQKDALIKAKDVLTHIVKHTGSKKWESYLFKINGQISMLNYSFDDFFRNIIINDTGVNLQPEKLTMPQYKDTASEEGYVSLTQSYNKAIELFTKNKLSEAKEEFEKLYQRIVNKDYRESINDLKFSTASIQTYLYIIDMQMK